MENGGKENKTRQDKKRANVVIFFFSLLFTRDEEEGKKKRGKNAVCQLDSNLRRLGERQEELLRWTDAHLQFGNAMKSSAVLQIVILYTLRCSVAAAASFLFCFAYLSRVGFLFQSEFVVDV